MNYKKYLIGERFKNNDNLEYEIISYCKDDRKRIIRFIDTNNEYEVFYSNIKTGQVRDKDSYISTICGIGINDLGTSNHVLYGRWQQMIRRCYDETHDSYKTYGAKGCYVDESWHKFSNYVKDIERKENYDKLIQQPKRYHIDKDTLIKNNKCYSDKTTLIVTIIDNLRERSNRLGMPKRQGKSVVQYDLNNNYIKEYKSMVDAQQETGIDSNYISNVCCGRQKTAGGYIWKYKNQQ